MDFYLSFFVWLTFLLLFSHFKKKKLLKKKQKTIGYYRSASFPHEMLLYLMKQANIFAANKLLV